MKINPKFVVTMDRLRDLKACWLDPPDVPDFRDKPCLNGCCRPTPKKVRAKLMTAYKRELAAHKLLMKRVEAFLGPEGKPLHVVAASWPADLSRYDLAWLAGNMGAPEDVAYPNRDGYPEAMIQLLRLEYGLPVT